MIPVPFSASYIINSHDCDCNNELRPSGTLRYLQETANLHIESAGFGYDRCIAKGQAFVLSRLAVSILKPLHAYDEITGQTWACESKGVSFNRCSRLLKDGEPVAVLSSVWAYIDFESKALIKVADSGLELKYAEPIEVSAPLKFRIPRDLPLEEVGKFTVGYSVCDRNMHMNNTRYPDMLCDFIPGVEKMRLKELSLSYLAEGHLGETLTVYKAVNPTDGSYIFRTIRDSDGKIGIEGRLLFEER